MTNYGCWVAFCIRSLITLSTSSSHMLSQSYRTYPMLSTSHDCRDITAENAQRICYPSHHIVAERSPNAVPDRHWETASVPWIRLNSFAEQFVIYDDDQVLHREDTTTSQTLYHDPPKIYFWHTATTRLGSPGTNTNKPALKNTYNVN